MFSRRSGSTKRALLRKLGASPVAPRRAGAWLRPCSGTRPRVLVALMVIVGSHDDLTSGRQGQQAKEANFPDPDFTILCDPLLGVARYTTKWITSRCDVIAFTTVIRTIAKRANTSIAQGLHSLLHPADSSPPQNSG